MEQHGIGIQNDVNQATERFLFREPFVLLPIICLSLLRGIASSVDEARLFAHVEDGHNRSALEYHGFLQTVATVPGIILMALISEIRGRKPVFLILFVFTLLSFILSYVPYQQPWVMIENFIVASLKGGVLAITGLVICEYCGPKHRFACLVANEVVKAAGARVTRILYSTEVLSKESSYLSLYEIMVTMACLGSVYWWPESPYWLASQGRHEESRVALLWLRGEGEAARGELRALESSRRRSSPTLFWLAALIAILSVTVARCAASGQQFLILIYEDRHATSIIPQLSHSIIITCSSVFVSIIIVLVSYKVKHKVVFLGAAIISIALLYILSAWTCIYVHVFEQVDNSPIVFYIMILICKILLECGLFNLGIVFSVELIPQKYYTYISCISYMYFIATSLLFFHIPFIYLDSFPFYGFLLAFATVALVGVSVMHWLLPETHGRNLLEIENLYLSKLYDENPGEVDVMLQNISR